MGSSPAAVAIMASMMEETTTSLNDPTRSGWIPAGCHQRNWVGSTQARTLSALISTRLTPPVWLSSPVLLRSHRSGWSRPTNSWDLVATETRRGRTPPAPPPDRRPIPAGDAYLSPRRPSDARPPDPTRNRATCLAAHVGGTHLGGSLPGGPSQQPHTAPDGSGQSQGCAERAPTAGDGMSIPGRRGIPRHEPLARRSGSLNPTTGMNPPQRVCPDAASSAPWRQAEATDRQPRGWLRSSTRRHDQSCDRESSESAHRPGDCSETRDAVRLATTLAPGLYPPPTSDAF